MAKHIVIERPNGIVTIVRSELETPSETPLTEHEQIINELYSKVKNLGLFSVMPRIVLEQEWEESTDDKTGWSGSGWNEPEGYELEEVVDYDKYNNPLKAIFVYGA